MSNKVYVGNLPYSFANDDLRNLFSAFGPVRKVEVVLDRETNRPRGFGFVEMETAEAVQAVIQNLHDTELQGRRLTVNEARERVGGNGGPLRIDSGARGAGLGRAGFGRDAGGVPPRRAPTDSGGGARAPEPHRSVERSVERRGDSSHRGGDGHRGSGRPKRDGESRWSDGGGRRRRRMDDFGDE